MFIQILRTEVLQDPLTGPFLVRLSVCTDFETTNAVAFGIVLAKLYQSIVNTANCEQSYIHSYFFGFYCSILATLQKLNIFEEQKLYGKAVGTQRLTPV